MRCCCIFAYLTSLHVRMQVRNASPEDINRSSLGRMVGGIALLWLASYAIGIPFKYGLAGALLAISAVLFAEWDQGSRARRSRNSRINLAVRMALRSATIFCVARAISISCPFTRPGPKLSYAGLAYKSAFTLIGLCRLVRRCHLLLG